MAVKRKRRSPILMETGLAAAPEHVIGASRSWLGRGGLRAMAAGAFLFALAPLEAAHAALGANTSSLARDHAALRGTLVVTPMQGYDVHQIVSASGVTVREYATHTGGVFAVTWSGPQVPDLKLLLGSYFDRYVALAQTRRTGHHVLSINTADLVMTAVRFQRRATGQVYVPNLLPNGVSRRELR
jgi:Protein of unknown function (DUF2844)